jgi:hypothetical protein
MAATKRNMNWTGVAFTPTSGSASTATGVTNCRVDYGGNLLKFSGDGDRGPSLVVNDFNEPSIAVDTADLAWAQANAPGTTGSFTCTHNDAKLSAGGAIVYTLNPCIVESPNADGEHRSIGKGNVKFVGIFGDGQTNPLSYTRS